MTSRSVTLVGYAVLLAAVLAWELVGLVGRRTPTLGDTVDRLTHNRWVRWLLLGAWIWLGWHLFARTG